MLTIAFLLFFNLENIQAPEEKLSFQISNVTIYMDTCIRGYSTAGAYSHFEDMIKNGIKTKQLAEVDIKRFQTIFDKSKQKKHWQRKFGLVNTFCEVNFKGIDFSHKMVISPGEDFIYIIDLSLRKEYIVTDSGDMNWIINVIKEYQTDPQH